MPNGSLIRFPSLAYDPLLTGYRVEGTLTLSGRSDLTIEGNGAVIRAFDALDPAVYNNWKRFRVESVAEGTRLSYKNWLEGEPEPGPWTITIENAEPRLQQKAGRFGLYGAR